MIICIRSWVRYRAAKSDGLQSGTYDASGNYSSLYLLCAETECNSAGKQALWLVGDKGWRSAWYYCGASSLPVIPGDCGVSWSDGGNANLYLNDLQNSSRAYFSKSKIAFGKVSVMKEKFNLLNAF